MATDRPGRYAKQLVSHLSKNFQGVWSEEDGRGELNFAPGRAELVAEDGALALRIDVPADQIDRFENVVGRHLVFFGKRDELVVQWERADGTPGQVFGNDSGTA
jgi:hypothetical protein